jgi:hypothetical protein
MPQPNRELRINIPKHTVSTVHPESLRIEIYILSNSTYQTGRIHLGTIFDEALTL